jgi:hypothetical protein
MKRGPESNSGANKPEGDNEDWSFFVDSPKADETVTLGAVEDEDLQPEKRARLENIPRPPFRVDMDILNTETYCIALENYKGQLVYDHTDPIYRASPNRDILERVVVLEVINELHDYLDDNREYFQTATDGQCRTKLEEKIDELMGRVQFNPNHPTNNKGALMVKHYDVLKNFKCGIISRVEPYFVCQAIDKDITENRDKYLQYNQQQFDRRLVLVGRAAAFQERTPSRTQPGPSTDNRPKFK